ncbi:MAG: sugar porter family MFS transporter [Bryobacterales bacterium]|nr:sugar porter family MFS transporter [Bryobacterales bacterium]
MNHRRLFTWSIIAALAGFLFGFDTIVISGAEQRIQTIWQLDSVMHGLCMSAALWGTVVGALFGGVPTERWGRRPTLLMIGIFYFVSAAWSGLATDQVTFMIARFIGGLGVGAATVASPLYISEISPAAMRGRLAAMFQFNIVLGIMVAFLSNYLLGTYVHESVAWRWMLGVEAIPALLYTAFCFRLPESPRWLIVHARRRDEAVEVFRQINPDYNEAQIQALADTVEASREEGQGSDRFFTRRLRIPIMLAFLVAFFNQLSGINAVLYFAPRIFEWAGLAKNAALLQSAGIGVANLFATYLGVWLIDRVGRRTLLYIGSVGYILSLGICSWAFVTGNFAIVPACIFAFIAAHAVGQGAVIWVLISEIFPNRHRATGQSFGCSVHWFFAATLTLVFPKMAEAFPPGTIFGFFCFMMCLQLLWVRLMVPETKNVPLEEMQKRLGVAA